MTNVLKRRLERLESIQEAAIQPDICIRVVLVVQMAPKRMGVIRPDY